MINKEAFSWELYYKAPIVAIIRGMKMETIEKIAQTCLDAGIYTLEVTMNTEGVLEIIRSLRGKFPGLNIGAGTVCSMNDLELALDAGAQFIVTPILDEDVIRAAVAKDIPIFPGAYTPTEIYRAWNLGAAAVKVFPASQLGVSYIKDVLAPLNQLKLVPTGGVSLDNIKDFFKAGACGVGVGSTFLNKELIAKGDFEGLKEYFLRYKEEIKDFIK